MSDEQLRTRAPVHVKLGQRVLIDAGAGCALMLERYRSGAVTLTNLASGTVLRQWSPKEAKNP